MSDDRLKNEIEHGKLLRESWSGTLRYWETPAGKLRWQRRVKMLTGHITPDMKVLELGCGVGYFTEYLAQTGATVIANDISPDLLEVARERVPAKNVIFKEENAYDLTYEDASFDSVVGSSVLHHLEIEQALKECFRVLKPGGTMFFTEPNLVNPQVYLERRIPYLQRKSHTSPDETAFVRGPLAALFQEHGFVDVNIQLFDFLHPYTPPAMIGLVRSVGEVFEKVPLIKEIAGSLYIRARKPQASSSE